ncbi:hypothetical protein M011DRAFT_461907 [Sporormia fimetaria CBS 119925]|uniref:Uncharacterized protein n=1 Tax=Sporormia fimetaria CBS 119925 TaxID=1340428 RepID=A0A6A6V1M1_9PLEO|nr:hypothetical protein M011DRAFT_461907 [Sporormia fimetaria CBS 119925]
MTTIPIRYAEARDWQDVMKNRSRHKMHELIERLGLRAKWSSNKRGKTNFDSPLVKELVLDMSTNIVAKLPKEPEELAAHLSAPDSLQDEVEELLRKHGSAIWGRMGDREHLVSAGEPGVEPTYYPRDLYYENEEDRELIRILLHWWIGLKACNVLLARDRLDRERKKKSQRSRHRVVVLGTFEDASGREPAPPSVPIAPAAVRPDFTPHALYGRPAQYAQALRLDTSYSSPASPLSGTPLHSNDSPVIPVYGASGEGHSIGRDLGGSRGGSTTGTLSHSLAGHMGADSSATLPRITPPVTGLPSVQQLGAEIGSLVSHFLEDSSTGERWPTPGSYGGQLQQALDAETLQAFRSYIYPSERGPKWDEQMLLRRLETAWRDKVRNWHKGTAAAGNAASFAACDRAFLTWIELRRHLADLEQANERWRQEPEGDQASDAQLQARIAQHKTLMSVSRDLVRSWDDLAASVEGEGEGGGGAGLTADAVLVQAFVLLAGDTTPATTAGTATEPLIWTPMNVAETVRWLRGHLEQFAAEEAEADEGLLYVRTGSGGRT